MLSDQTQERAQPFGLRQRRIGLTLAVILNNAVRPAIAADFNGSPAAENMVKMAPFRGCEVIWPTEPSARYLGPRHGKL